MRVQGPYKSAEVEGERTKLAPLARLIKGAGYACDQGDWRTNRHTLMLGHYREEFPFDMNADTQVQWVLDVFSATLSAIDGNTAAMRLLRQVREYA